MKKNGKIKSVLHHLKGDIKSFNKEAREDKELIHELKESSSYEKREDKREKKKSKKKASSQRKAPKVKRAKAKAKKIAKQRKK
jgi:hypothetical protein